MIRARLLMLGGLLALATSVAAQQARMTQWVERNPTGANDRIALGYAVPIPVDTPLPFDGFRSYAGLHARHQDLQATTPWVHGEVVGTTLAGRDIWAYRLGDADLETVDGLPEPAMLTNGGIHAREWQSPEVVTGILELLATHPEDDHFYDYLRENLNVIVIPTLNIDGFLQTQRYPARNYLNTDPSNPDTSPRDGRMRRKNMRNADEDLLTTLDHLEGVDLNRNNAPFWNTNPERSSSDSRSLVHHGVSPASEPETRALDAAAGLGPVEELRLYTDVHSFSQVHFWARNANNRLTGQTEAVLSLFSNHHRSFVGKNYLFSNRASVPVSQGIGSTDEYFTHTYQVPSWTLEVEPTGGQAFHAPSPGCGADYGGEANNCHDGFILPESEITRVREQLAQSFAAVYYRQAGPPAVLEAKVFDPESEAVVFEAAWDPTDTRQRERYLNQLQALQLGRAYTLWVAYSKPMRWREGGAIVPFPGQLESSLFVSTGLRVGDNNLTVETSDPEWRDRAGPAPGGYLRYRDDAVVIGFTLPRDEVNSGQVVGSTEAQWAHLTADMVRMLLDGNPATAAYWRAGAWSGYENSAGEEGDTGDVDRTLSVQLTDQDLLPPFLAEPGLASAWADPSRDGEGFIIEMLADQRAVLYWFTYDDAGSQDWYIATGQVTGNRILFPELLRLNGGVFGPAFDPGKVTREVVGSASFTWSGCDEGKLVWRVGQRLGRQSVLRLTRLAGLGCGSEQAVPPAENPAHFSGAWFDPSHDGEGYTLEMLSNGTAVVYWFSYDPAGNRRWFFGVGEVQGSTLVFNELSTTRGARFGAAFDPNDVAVTPWGTLQLELDCASGTATYASDEAGFGSGQLSLVRLTAMAGLECDG